MKTNILRKNTLLLMALTILAMIFTGCKKDNSSSDGGITPPVGKLGIMTLDNQSYEITSGEYYDDIQLNILTIELADGDANVHKISFTGHTEIPLDSFEYTLKPEEGASGMFLLGSDVLYCKSGTVTISKAGSNYKIESDGVAGPLLGFTTSPKNFTVTFEGPIKKHMD